MHYLRSQKSAIRTSRAKNREILVSKRGSGRFELLFLFGIVELGRIAEPQNLTGRVPRENAVRPLGFERDDRDVPWTGAVRRRHTAARQAFERFELEDRRGWFDADGT